MTYVQSTGRAPRLLVGVDLGHGETAVCTGWEDSSDEPALLNVHYAGKAFPTAVARLPDSFESGHSLSTFIGPSCFLASTLRSALEIYFAFKTTDWGDGSPQTPRRALTLFMEHLVSNLQGFPQEDGTTSRSPLLTPGAELHWLIGVPSGWTVEQRQEYRALLAGICPGGVELVSESRAALLHGRASGQIEDPLTGTGAVEGSSLVVDLGSSTADYTLVAELSATPWKDRGHGALGASLIDRELMRRVVDAHEDRGRLLTALQVPEWRISLEYACRMAKEAFFVGALDLHAPDEVVGGRTATVRTAGGEEIKVSIDPTRALIDDILETPLPELSGLSWRETLRQELGSIKEQLGSDLRTIMLAGGASRMPFVHRLCQEVFPHSTLVQTYEPEFTVARGLVIAGRTRVHVEGFGRDVEEFLASEQIEGIVRGRLPALAERIGTIMTEGLVERDLIPEIRLWRAERIDTLAEVEQRVVRKRTRYLGSDEFRKVLDQEVRLWVGALSEEVDELTAPICRFWGVPPGALSLAEPRFARHAPTFDLNADGAVAPLDAIGNIAIVVAGLVAAYVGLVAVAVALNPVGVAVAAVIGVVAVVLGLTKIKKATMETMRTSNIWGWARRVGTEDWLVGKIRSKAEEEGIEAKAATEVAAKIMETEEKRLTSAVSDSVRRQMREAARVTLLMIEPPEEE